MRKSLGLSLGLFLLFPLVALCQTETKKDNAWHIKRSTKTTNSPDYKDKGEPRLKQIYITSTEGTYYGNPCVEEVAANMGFHYTLMYGYAGEKVHYWLGNQSKYFLLMFRNGPFWRHRYKKKVRECVGYSSDFTG